MYRTATSTTNSQQQQYKYRQQQSQQPGLSKSKSICVMLIVIGCFVVLWPRIFYPMLLVGVNWRPHGSGSEGQGSWRNGEDAVLPPKVREAMRSSPIRDGANLGNAYRNTKPLPGRPQFYSGARDIRNAEQFQSSPGGGGGSGGTMMNLMVPVYTIVVAIVFLYIMLKMSFTDDQEQRNQCLGESRSNVNPRDPLQQSMPGYRAFARAGQGNASQSMQSLVQDIETFRNHLAAAQVCQCKLRKYELARKVTENCANEMAKESETIESDRDAEQEQLDDNDLKSVGNESIDEQDNRIRLTECVDDELRNTSNEIDENVSEENVTKIVNEISDLNAATVDKQAKAELSSSSINAYEYHNKSDDKENEQNVDNQVCDYNDNDERNETMMRNKAKAIKNSRAKQRKKQRNNKKAKQVKTNSGTKIEEEDDEDEDGDDTNTVDKKEKKFCKKFHKIFDKTILHKWDQEMRRLTHLKDE